MRQRKKPVQAPVPIFGAAVHNLLKLYEWIAGDGCRGHTISLPEPKELEVITIY